MDENIPASLIERDRLNDLIEEAYAQTALAAVEIMRYQQDELGALTDMNRRFFTPFCLMILLTSGMPQLHANPELMKKSRQWTQDKVSQNKLKEINDKLLLGIEIFYEYSVALQEAGLIRLTSRSS